MASTGEVWRLARRPELDGVRGVAVLLVVLAHTGLPLIGAGGQVGVTVFFTLSGFLITALLLEEQARGRIDLGKFYLRRARRLLPALFFMLASLTAALAAVGVTVSIRHDVLPVALYYGNWVRATGEYVGYWSHTWSLAVEEQFYMLWPLVVIAAARYGRKALATACVAGAGYSLVARALLWHGGAGEFRTYYGTDMHLDALLLGALLAAYMHGRPARSSHPRVAAGLLVGVVAWVFSGKDFAGFVVALSVVPFLTVALLYCTAQGREVRWLTARPLVLLGQRSYGLYLWHYPILALGGAMIGHGPAATALMLAASWGVTCLSWRYVEQPFLRRKDHGPVIVPEVAETVPPDVIDRLARFTLAPVVPTVPSN